MLTFPKKKNHQNMQIINKTCQLVKKPLFLSIQRKIFKQVLLTFPLSSFSFRSEVTNLGPFRFHKIFTFIFTFFFSKIGAYRPEGSNILLNEGGGGCIFLDLKRT